MLLQSNRSIVAALAAVLTLALWSRTLTNAPSLGAPAQASTHLVYAAPSAPVLM